MTAAPTTENMKINEAWPDIFIEGYKHQLPPASTHKTEKLEQNHQSYPHM